MIAAPGTGGQNPAYRPARHNQAHSGQYFSRAVHHSTEDSVTYSERASGVTWRFGRKAAGGSLGERWQFDFAEGRSPWTSPRNKPPNQGPLGRPGASGFPT